MSNAALIDLRARILSNTLTASQQGALAAALDEIEPTFPTPDELANSIPQFEQTLVRDWYASLYSIALGGGAMPPPPPGGISDVTGTDPIDVTTPSTGVRNVAISPATTADAGSLSAADKTKLNALNPAAQVTFADDLAGSNASHQWVAALSGAGGVPGVIPLPANAASALLVGAGTAPPGTGLLRVRLATTTEPILVQRDNSNTFDSNIIGREIGELIFANELESWRMKCAVRAFFQVLSSSNGTNDAGNWWLFSDIAGTVAKFFSDDQTYEWHQGGPDEQKDGVIYRMNFANTHDETLQVIGPDQPTTVLVDNAINIVTVTLGAWDLTVTPYQYASWTLEQTYSKQAGVVTETTTPPTVSAPRESTTGIAALVNPQMVVDNVPIGTGTGFNVTVTPWTSNQQRWEYFSTIKVLSDPGDD